MLDAKENRFYRVPDSPDAAAELAALRARVAELEAALREIVEDVSDRFDMDSPSTNPGMKHAVAQGRAALSAGAVSK